MNRSKITWRVVPTVIMVCLFSLGIYLSSTTQETLTWIIPSLLIASLIVMFLPIQSGHLTVKSIVVGITLIATGFYHANQQKAYRLSQLPHESILKSKQAYSFLIKDKSSTDAYHNLEVDVLSLTLSDGRSIPLHNQSAILKIKKDAPSLDVKFGQLFTATTKLNPIEASTLEDQNMYVRYLHQSGIDHICYIKEAEDLIFKGISSSPYSFVRYNLRQRAIDVLDNHIHDDHAQSILKALLLGYKSDLDKELKSSFIDSGTMHILAVSGLHTGVIALILMTICKWLFFWTTRRSLFRLVFIISGLVLFAELSGGAPPVWRAVIMLSIYLIGKYFSAIAHSLNLIAVAALILLVWDHNYLYNLSFQLSFAAVTGIILIYPILEKVYYPRGKIAKYVVGIIYMGIAAQVALLPLSFYYFHKISLLSPFTSVIAISIAFLCISGSCLLFLSVAIAPALTWYIASFLEGIIFVLTQTTSFMSSTALVLIDHLYLEWYESFLLALGILCIAIAYHRRSFRLVKIGLSLLVVQSVLHLNLQSKHLDEVSIVYKDSEEISEIHVGHTSVVISADSPSFQATLKRKEHHISSVIYYDDLIKRRGDGR